MEFSGTEGFLWWPDRWDPCHSSVLSGQREKKKKKRSGLTTAMWQNWDKYLTLVWPCLMVGSNFLLSACSFTPNKQRTKALVAFHTSSVSTLHTDGLPYKGGPPQRTEEMNSPTISCRIAQIPTLCPSLSCSRRHIFSSFRGVRANVKFSFAE